MSTRPFSPICRLLWSWTYRFVPECFKEGHNAILILVILILFGASIIVHVLGRSPIACLICAVVVLVHVGVFVSEDFIREPQVADVG
jgi:hypothetical protein